MNPISDLAQVAGTNDFILEHLLFGVVLGLLVALSRRPNTANSVTA